MFYEGKKYACDACVRGHRVSGCNHNDRPLQEIAKKGRPVSQCQHCRTMRKSRAAHVKCDCGDKAKGPVKHHYINENGKLVEMPESAETSDVKENNGPCHCSTRGTRCVCSIKKEILDAVPELATAPRSGIPKKPTLQSNHSDTSLTRFTNGHHRPTPRHNHTHHGAPYHIPHHGTHSMAIPADLLAEAERPVNQAVRSLTSETLPTAISLQQPPGRLVKSEHNSPGLKPLTFTQSAAVSGTTTPITDQMSPGGLLRSISDFNLSSAGLRATPDLSLRTDFTTFESAEYPSQEYYMSAASDFPVPPNTAVWPTDQHQFENLFEMPPELTQSLSGDDSEVGDFGLSAGLSPVHNLSPGLLSGGPLSPESSEVCESEGYVAGISAHSSILNMSSLALQPTGAEMPNMDNYLSGNHIDYTGYDTSGLNTPAEDGKASGLNSYCNSVRNSLQFQDNDVLMMMPLVPSQNMPKFEFRQ